MTDLMLELGRDFCFVGSEYPLQVGTRDFTLDLLLFHRGLNCLVAMEQYTLPNGSNASMATGTGTLVASGTVNSLGNVPISPTLAAGSYTPQLAHGGGANHPASASTTLTITRAMPALSWPNPANITDNTPLSNVQLSATVGGITGGDVVGTFIDSPPAETNLSAGQNQVLAVTFNPTTDDAHLSASASTTAHISVIAPTHRRSPLAHPRAAPWGTCRSALSPRPRRGLRSRRSFHPAPPRSRTMQSPSREQTPSCWWRVSPAIRRMRRPRM